MKRLPVLAVLLASGLVLSATAQTPAAPAGASSAAATTPAGPPKIAVIAFQVAVGQTNEFQRNFADLQKKFDPKRQQPDRVSRPARARPGIEGRADRRVGQLGHLRGDMGVEPFLRHTRLCKIGSEW